MFGTLTLPAGNPLCLRIHRGQFGRGHEDAEVFQPVRGAPGQVDGVADGDQDSVLPRRGAIERLGFHGDPQCLCHAVQSGGFHGDLL
jgi:hypothetical protein